MDSNSIATRNFYSGVKSIYDIMHFKVAKCNVDIAMEFGLLPIELKTNVVNMKSKMKNFIRARFVTWCEQNSKCSISDQLNFPALSPLLVKIP